MVNKSQRYQEKNEGAANTSSVGYENLRLLEKENNYDHRN
jgi:hypothetical protein